MDVRELAVPGAWLIAPQQYADRRGSFFELHRHSRVVEATGRPFPVAQVNFSSSRKGTLRGIHGTLTPPGQAKVVTCVRGAVLDVVVDTRLGSPTFGRHDMTRLDAESGMAVYVSEGLGHGFLALTDDACVCYLCSAEFVPGTQVDINALDPDLAIDWGLTGEPLMSDKDAAALGLAEAAQAGLLPTYDECRALEARLRAAG
ncbi:dTDP-4-dehydrorhamnose 3,5-epimerase family protein [Actinokineospora sp. NBRC 105648]|uniref:dTDP-4-dehydrorhamnose 3,5-epimerase family protein n=1 Tax=Actinokineospora sp. NBRC 105648 TaxID=3032206 RepID=UPI0024A1696B|nr:dTDP-4-dehydrorhamnose 3,5-epimerase family protein [Actinokineospora sp. NBRC 105648]GLZ36626.1 dTDP-4-dehydrorhamnose 3,5-epimerase [Actinokineospora sp. NBRC 105648]